MLSLSLSLSLYIYIYIYSGWLARYLRMLCQLQWLFFLDKNKYIHVRRTGKGLVVAYFKMQSTILAFDQPEGLGKTWQLVPQQKSPHVMMPTKSRLLTVFEGSSMSGEANMASVHMSIASQSVNETCSAFIKVTAEADSLQRRWEFLSSPPRRQRLSKSRSPLIGADMGPNSRKPQSVPGSMRPYLHTPFWYLCRSSKRKKYRFARNDLFSGYLMMLYQLNTLLIAYIQTVGLIVSN
jgi:hypothetical protein